MADREKVENALDCRADGFGLDCKDCAYYREDTPAYCNFRQILRDAISMLKEQDETIKELQNAYGYLQKQFFEVQDKLLKEQEAVVRCKDCKHYLPGKLFSCGIYNVAKNEDWFCADGKRREGE